MAMGTDAKVLQVVGFKNSGKTTVMEHLIKKLTSLNYRVGTIKHHGHGHNPPDYSLVTKDHFRHFQSGANVSFVEGNQVGHILLKTDHMSLKKIIDLYNFFSLDVILVEGYKYELYPKVVLIRNEDDLHLLETLTNIRCVLTHVELTKLKTARYPYFLVKEMNQFVTWLCNKMEEMT